MKKFKKLIYIHFKLKKNKILYFFLIIFFNHQLLSEEIGKTNIKLLHDAIIQMNNSSQSEEKTENFREVLSKVYNYKKMIAFIYGTNWKDLNIEKKNKIEELFLDFMNYNYLKRFNKIKNLSFEIKASKLLNEKRVLIKTHLIVKNSDLVRINYIMLKEEDSWKIFDVLYNGSISEISTKKSEFSAIIQSGGADKLITKLSEKVTNRKE